MRALKWMAVVLAMTLAPSQSQSSELADKLNKAEDLLSSGQPKAAFEQLDALVDDFWARSPMFVRKAVFARNISGYGIYEEVNAEFKVNEPQVIYVEPIGFTYADGADGGAEANWSVDYTLTNTAGATLFQKDDFLELGLPLGQRNREIHLTLTVNLTGLKPGSYVSHYVLKDKNSEKTAKFTLPFDVIE